MKYAPGPMTKEDWINTKMIKRGDPSARHNFGNANAIDRRVILLVDDFAAAHNRQVLVTCGTEGQHVKDSLHYQGKALDIMFPQLKRRELKEVYLQLLKYPFGGIGIYSEWKLRPDWECIGGFHVDVREGDITATWMKGPDTGYIGVTIANMQKYMV